MSQSENILNELQEISTLVAGIGNVNVYDLPADYFNSLPDQILQQVENTEESTSLTQYREGSMNMFEVPPGYFEKLPERVLSFINNMEDQGTKEELARLSPLLSDVPNSLPYSVPGDYFNELVDDVISGAQAIDFVNQKLEIESSILYQAERKNVYTVPSGYFVKLPYTILDKVKTSRSVSFGSAYRKVLGYALAAVVAGVMSIAGWSYFHQSQSSNLEPELAGIKKVGADEISKYLESAPVSPVETAGFAVADSKNDEIRKLLADVSDEELEQYLELHSVSKDLLTD